MGQHLVTHDPCDPSDFRDPFDPFPALVRAYTLDTIRLCYFSNFTYYFDVHCILARGNSVLESMKLRIKRYVNICNIVLFMPA